MQSPCAARSSIIFIVFFVIAGPTLANAHNAMMLFQQAWVPPIKPIEPLPSVSGEAGHATAVPPDVGVAKQELARADASAAVSASARAEIGAQAIAPQEHITPAKIAPLPKRPASSQAMPVGREAMFNGPDPIAGALFAPLVIIDMFAAPFRAR